MTSEKGKKKSTLIVLTGINAADSNHPVLSCCFSWGGWLQFFESCLFPEWEKLKTSHLHPGRLASWRSSSWIESFRSNICSAIFWPDPKHGRKFLSRSRSPGTFRRDLKRPPWNEALGICWNGPSLKDAKPASSQTRDFQNFCSGNRHPRVNFNSSCSSARCSLASKRTPSGSQGACDPEWRAWVAAEPWVRGWTRDPCSEAQQ